MKFRSKEFSSFVTTKKWICSLKSLIVKPLWRYLYLFILRQNLIPAFLKRDLWEYVYAQGLTIFSPPNIRNTLWWLVGFLNNFLHSYLFTFKATWLDDINEVQPPCHFLWVYADVSFHQIQQVLIKLESAIHAFSFQNYIALKCQIRVSKVK